MTFIVRIAIKITNIKKEVEIYKSSSMNLVKKQVLRGAIRGAERTNCHIGHMDRYTDVRTDGHLSVMQRSLRV